ncbi:hypothetical protein Q4520_09740 [Alteromonas sp. 1_MG-2023]|nr:hypothetical protein [Alteromonas sp. 1_MG-2023]MDO6475705.1 hypothetical protein [Alteromonas sp. 1_MG-2023]
MSIVADMRYVNESKMTSYKHKKGRLSLFYQENRPLCAHQAGKGLSI